MMVERDEEGFIKAGHGVVNAPAWKGMSRSPGPLETSWPGIFAAGDVRSGSVKRCAAAVGEGGMAVEGVHEVLKTYARLRASRASGPMQSAHEPSRCKSWSFYLHVVDVGENSRKGNLRTFRYRFSLV